MNLSTMTSADTFFIWIFVVSGAIMGIICIAANLCKEHESCRPDRTPTDLCDAETKSHEDISKLRSMTSHNDTARQCKNKKCQRVVSYKKITGDYCSYCYVASTPVPKHKTEQAPIKAIPSEVVKND